MSRIEVQFTGTLSFEVDEETRADDYGQYSMELAIARVIENDLNKQGGTYPEAEVTVEDISLIDDCYDDDDWDDDGWDDDDDDYDYDYEEDWVEIEEIKED